VLEEVAVIRSELDHERLLPELEPLADHLNVRAGVLDPRRRVRRKIPVVVEDLVDRHEGLELDEEAALAHEDLQRIERLHLPDLVGPQEVLAQRRHAEIHERQ
jgi:hypothetical protein